MLAVESQLLHEIESGQGLSLGKASKLLPGLSGGNVCPSTLSRWVSVGARATDGRRVRLEAIRCGGRLLTSQAAIRRFMLALSQSADAIPAPRSDAERNRASKAAEKKLIAAGY